MAGIWAFIIPILVQLIVSFLTELLKNLNPPPTRFRLMGSPVLPDLVGAKAQFMSKLKWRIWLGPKRFQYGSALYDKAHGNFLVNMSGGSLDIPGTVANCTAGLSKLTPADLGDGLTKFKAEGSLNFKVLPNGLVQGGMASYLLDATGLITYRASIRIGKWFLAKTYESQGQYQVDPQLLKPSNLVVGKVITIGSLQMKVMSLSPNTALVSVSIFGQKANGSAILATNLPVVTLQSLDSSVNVFGVDLIVGLRQD